MVGWLVRSFVGGPVVVSCLAGWLVGCVAGWLVLSISSLVRSFVKVGR